MAVETTGKVREKRQKSCNHDRQTLVVSGKRRKVMVATNVHDFWPEHPLRYLM